MAILKKRTSSKQLPEARGLDRAPLDSIIRGSSNAPSLTGRGPSSITSTGGSNATQNTGSSNRPLTSSVSGGTKPSLTTGASSTPKTTLAPRTSLTPKTTPTTNPTVTNKTPTTPTTKTTSPTSVVKPTVKTPKTSTNSTTNAITNALTGAALGAGTKLIMDKISGKPTTGKTDAPVAGQPKISSGNASSPANSKSAKDAAAKKQAADAAKKKAASGPTSVVKPPSDSLGMPKGSVDNGDGTYTANGTTFDMSTNMPLYRDNAAGGVDLMTDNGDGTYTIGNTTYSMENDSVLYTTDASGKITVPSSGGASSGDAGKVNNDNSSYFSKEPVIGPPKNLDLPVGRTISGTTENGDGTTTVNYSDGSTETLDENFEVVGTTPSDGAGSDGEISADLDGGSGAEDTIVAEADPEYFQDDDGNIYIMNADGGYELAYYADGSAYEDTYTDDSDYTEDTTFADNTYYDEESGQTWHLSDSGMWTLEGDEPTDYGDSLYADNTDYTNEDDFLYAGNDDYTDYNDYTDYTDYNDYSDYEYAKRGGLITMMKNGGVPHFADGGDAYMPYGAEDNGDGTYTIDNEVFDMETGDPLYTMNDSGDIMYVEPSANSDYTDNGDGTYTMGGITYDVMTDMPLYGTDTKGNILLSQDNGDGTFSIGNETYDMGTSQPVYTTNTRTGGITVDPNVIRNSGSGSRSSPSLGSYLDKGVDIFKGVAGKGYDALSGALGTTAGAAGAGALVATLLGQDFSGNTDNQNQGLDMSKVGVINPRTTDFGIGPTRFVGYDDYGTGGGDYAPNEELLRNLNAPGFNPVNEGDYGYEEVAAEEEAPKMASGGLSSMATPVASYYTFGQPADILANLGMRPQPPSNPPEMMPQIGQQQSPQQTQQQGLPQQAPPQMMQQTPQGMPQQGMMPQQQGMPPPMRKGGLPHVSNVPLTQGRMDFRKGAAVHGEGDGQSDDIPAMLADGEYVIDAETVAQIGNGSTKAGAQALDKFREGIRAHKRSAPINKIPPKTKPLTSYLKGAK